ncbi:hypothetical protein GQ457_16G008060 [Hibiscus cannabinus]
MNKARFLILHRNNPVPDLRESLHDYTVVARRIQLQEAPKQLPEIAFGVDSFLQDHLKHGMSKVLVGIVGILHHGDAVDDFRETAAEFIFGKRLRIG